MSHKLKADMSCSNLSQGGRLRHRLTFATLLVVSTLLPALAAQAASSDWAVNEGGRMRLILLPAGADGLRQGALVIEPRPGWITYWKEPGDVGIPPAIVPLAGAPYSVERVEFPVPKVLMSGDMTDVGYDHPVTLPITLKDAPDDLNVTLNAFIGVCQNICIPFQADLTVPADPVGASSPVETALIAAAKAKVPPGPSADFQVLGHSLQAETRQLIVSLKLPQGAATPTAFVSGPSGHVFVKATASQGPDGETMLTMPIGKLPKKYKIAGKQWGILVISGERAMETTLAFD